MIYHQRDSVCKRLANCLLDDDYHVICEMYGLELFLLGVSRRFVSICCKLRLLSWLHIQKLHSVNIIGYAATW